MRTAQISTGIGSKFIELWRKYFTVISTSVFYLVLLVVQHTMEPDFKCPESKTWGLWYSLGYIFVPPIALFLLGVIVQPRSKCKDIFCCKIEKCVSGCCCRITWLDPEWKKTKRFGGVFMKAFKPTFLWIIIMLLDGKYVDCVWKSRTVNGPAGNSQLVTTAYHVSQFIGLVFILVIPCGGFTWWLFCNRSTERIPIEAEQSKTLLKDKAAKYLKEQRDEAIQKLIEKHLNDKYAAAPETFQIELTDDEISDKIKEGFNVARGNQPPAAGRENASGRAGSSNGRNAATPSENQTRNGQDSNQTEMQNLLDNEASSTSPEGTSSPSPQQASTV